MPHPLAGCSETLKRFNEALQSFRIYTLSYEALQRFIEALSNLMRPWFKLLLRPGNGSGLFSGAWRPQG